MANSGCGSAIDATLNVALNNGRALIWLLCLSFGLSIIPIPGPAFAEPPETGSDGVSDKAYDDQTLTSSIVSMTRFQNANADTECVILLHGMARTEKAMRPMQGFLSRQGYQVINLGYPSRQHSVETLSTLAISPALEACEKLNASRIHFVTHSLGGILLRHYLTDNVIHNHGRTVMLGPPNQGSEVVDKLGKLPGFNAVNGPAGQQLGTHANSMPNSLGGVNFDLGVIAGTQSINLFLSTLIPGKDDGKVSVERTKVEGMSDFIAMPTTHPLMMRNKQVMAQTLHFLKTGRFSHE